MGATLKRPLIYLAISMISGILALYYFSLLITILLCLSLSVIVICVYTKPLWRCEYRLAAAGAAVFFIIGVCASELARNDIYNKFSRFDGMEVTLTGIVQSEVRRELLREGNQDGGSVQFKTKYVLKVTEIMSNKISGKVLLQDYSNTPLKYGEEIVVGGTLQHIPGRRNPGGFDYRRYLAGQGVSAMLTVSYGDVRITGNERGSPLVKAGLDFRDKIIRSINKNLPKQQAGLMCAMLIGSRDGLSEPVEECFSIAGLTHIMAVSGANVAFIIMPVLFILKRIRIRRNAANIITGLIITFFLFITGFEPSVIRAVIMAVIMLTGQILHREADALTSLAFSCIVMLLINPFFIFNCGFQLSYAATLSLVTLSPVIKKRLDAISQIITGWTLPRFISGLAASTIAAQLGVLPVIINSFNRISIMSLIANLAVLPVLEGITICGAAMVLTAQICEWFSMLIGYVANVLLTAVLYITKVLSSIPFASVDMPCLPVTVILLFYLLLWGAYYKSLKNIRFTINQRLSIIVTAAFIICTAYSTPYSKFLQVTVLDVGEGDCIFIRTPAGKSVLIDAGGSNYGTFDTGASIVVPFLFYNGITALDTVIISHTHEDHIGGMPAVFKKIRVHNLIIPGLDDEQYSDLCSRLFDASYVNRGKTRIIRSNSPEYGFRLDDKTLFHIFDPAYMKYLDESYMNNMSLMVRLEYGKVSMIFPGDNETPAERQLIRAGIDMAADVLKVSHHGSDTSTCDEFVKETRPRVAIISVGKNRFGHPSPDVLERLERSGAVCRRTDLDGAVIIRTDGNRVAVGMTVPNDY